jgi:large conductance mechanosensitive channel
MGLIQEFRDFAMKGNVVDMAVGIVIGAGFSGVVNAFVAKVVMPLVGLMGGVDFSQYDIMLKAAEGEKPAVMLGVGSFVTALLQFLIVAFAIFMVIKAMNAAKAKFENEKEEAPAKPAEDIVLLREIRDALRTR